MSKFKRFLIVLAVLAVVSFFLWPTVRWYFIIPEDQKALALGSREQIREYALKKAAVDLDELKRLAAEGGAKPLPAELEYTTALAKKAYKAVGEKSPKTWDATGVLAGFDNEGAALSAIEGRYRNRIMGTKSVYGDAIQLGLDLSGGMSIIIQTNTASVKERLGRDLNQAEKTEAMQQGLEILRSRIDTFGLTEPVIRQMGADQIYVEIPGPSDPERIKGIIMGKGKLAFHIVDSDATAAVEAYLAANPAGISANNTLDDPSIVPAGYVVRRYYQRDAYGIDEFAGKYFVVTEKPGLDGNYIKDAQVTSDPITGAPAVGFNLTKEGGDIFYQLTSANLNKTMCIILDDKVKNYANIESAIKESGQITGLSSDEANQVSRLLKSAALPIELEPVSQQAIGASLGEDAIKQGANALMYGLLAVLVFMFLYYKGAGINAMFAQVLNMFIMVGVLSAFNMTLSLPSIAGFVLTIGMAVDANVIVFERIKEELKAGKGRKASIEAGFNKAFWAIFDSNLTTIIAAVFLALLGSGPIQGFAVSLAIGNVSSLFTALFVSHLIFDVGTDVFKSKRVSISWRIK
jgi:preprotein translocase subunit SecD